MVFVVFRGVLTVPDCAPSAGPARSRPRNAGVFAGSTVVAMSSRRTTRRGRRGSDAVLITDARQSRIRNYNYRRQTYAILQWSRIPMLLLAAAAFLWWDLAWLAAILTVVSVPMPWIAVVIANGVGEPADKRSPRVYKPGVVREQNRRWEEAQRERMAQLAD